MLLKGPFSECEKHSIYFFTPLTEGPGTARGEKIGNFGVGRRAAPRGVGGAKPPKMGFCSGGTRGAKKWQKMAFLGQKRAKNDDF
jgi:hypothetical protein